MGHNSSRHSPLEDAHAFGSSWRHFMTWQRENKQNKGRRLRTSLARYGCGSQCVLSAVVSPWAHRHQANEMRTGSEPCSARAVSSSVLRSSCTLVHSVMVCSQPETCIKISILSISIFVSSVSLSCAPVAIVVHAQFRHCCHLQQQSNEIILSSTFSFINYGQLKLCKSLYVEFSQLWPV